MFSKLEGMTHQTSFAQAEFAAKKKITRREKFLTRMEEVIPWTRLLAVIEPFYPKGERGRPPVGLERMLRVYFLQQWYGLADEALESSWCRRTPGPGLDFLPAAPVRSVPACGLSSRRG